MEKLYKVQMNSKGMPNFSTAVEVADRPQGKWVTIDTEVVSVPVYWNEEQRQSDERGAGILEKCECSVCGWRKNFMGYKKLGVNKSYNYCPNCGAKMKGTDDETN